MAGGIERCADRKDVLAHLDARNGGFAFGKIQQRKFGHLTPPPSLPAPTDALLWVW